MRFSDAYLRLTSDYIPEVVQLTHGQDRLYRMLGDAAAELASAYGFPRYTYRLNVAENATSIQLPDIAPTGTTPAYPVRNLARIDRASLGGRVLTPGPREVASLDDGYMSYLQGWPRNYYWRPEGREFAFLPKAPIASTVVIDSVHALSRDTGTNGSLEVWNGLHEAWHDLVVMSAAVAAFTASYEEDRAGVIQQMLSQRQSQFVVYLNGRDLRIYAPQPGGSA